MSEPEVATAQRRRLPNRRASLVIEFDHITPGDRSEHYFATLGYHPDGQLGEIFINTTKIGTDLDISVKDAAILASFALQHGCPLDAVRLAMTRDARGRPEGVMGTLLDLLAAPEPAPSQPVEA